MKTTNLRTLLVFFIAMQLNTNLFAQNLPLLNPLTQQKFVNELPQPAVMQPQSSGGNHYEIKASQFLQDLGLKDLAGNPMLTTVWGYNGSFPAATIEARQDKPVTVKWINALVDSDGNALPHLLPVDTTIDWAMPENWPESGVPIVTHLHGGHIESASDGNPEAWFTPNFGQVGPVFSQETYTYSNDQEASTLWYHDHAMGITRLNVYAGLAGFYLLRSAWEDKLNLPGGKYEIPIVIQDRMFTADGQLYYPSKPEVGEEPNESVLPEMFGDFILVNGKTWPVLNVEPRKYRFRYLNGSDSRFYNLYFDHGIDFVQIGTDQGLLNAPVKLSQLLLGCGERKDVIIDFSDPALAGRTLIMRNNAHTPFPKGSAANPQTTGQIMAFKVVVPLNGTDSSVVPTTLRETPIAPLAKESITRRLILAENLDELGRLKPQLGTIELGALDYDDPITENPMLDAIEEWDLINTTPDAHPIHLHLVNFQVVSRQKFNQRKFVPGNPASLNLIGNPILPTADESGWKDTQIAYPGEVTRIKAKFDIEGLYVWHCHILSHEDHEMMRPFYVGSADLRIASNVKSGKFNVSVFPNPLTNKSVVNMEIYAEGEYKAELFNSMGQRISLLADSYYAKGTHEISLSQLPDSNLSNGVYLLRVQGSGGISSNKLLFKGY